jgi:hypothetical protein
MKAAKVNIEMAVSNGHISEYSHDYQQSGNSDRRN